MTFNFTTPRTAPDQASLLPITEAIGVGSVFVTAGALFSLTTLIFRRRQLSRKCAKMPVVTRVGKVRLCASDEIRSPFAARLGGVAFIVVPTSLLAEHSKLRLVVGHEAYHHRRGDLHAAAFIGYLRALFFWNPLLAIWERSVAELQDLACDQQMIRRARVSPIEYSRTLLWAAEAVQGKRYVLTGARGMADGSAASLKRRILMLNETRSRSIRIQSWFLAIAGCGLVAGTSWVVHGAARDHRVTLSQVENFGVRIGQRSEFPVVVDDQVVSTLNQWVAIPGSRDFMKKALVRAPAYRGMIEQTMQASGLPTELVGMVMAESAFDNEASSNAPIHVRAAGIWQIIPETARRLGLTVSPTLDERMEPRKATAAAAVLLSGLFSRYGDWPVAIAAYFAGHSKVDALIEGASSKTEMRARVLAGEEKHARYVRSIMASIILLDNPALLQ